MTHSSSRECRHSSHSLLFSWRTWVVAILLLLSGVSHTSAQLRDRAFRNRHGSRTDFSSEYRFKGPSDATHFLVSSTPDPLAQREVTYDECGSPLCPPKELRGPPPKEYRCDCSDPHVHPDCLPRCSHQAPPPNPYMPTKSCNCPYASTIKTCPCGQQRKVVGQDFPITKAHMLKPGPHKPEIKPYVQSAEPPNPIPPPEPHECRPNIHGVGPGNCFAAPSSSLHACSSPHSNCRSMHSKSWVQANAHVTRTADCTCKEPAPAPCGCPGEEGRSAPHPSAPTAAAAAPGSSSQVTPLPPGVHVGSGSASLHHGYIPVAQALPLVSTSCDSRRECDRNFQQAVRAGDTSAEVQLLRTENKRLRAAAAEFHRMEAVLKQKLAANPDPAVSALLRKVEQETQTMDAAVREAQKSTAGAIRRVA